MRNIFKIAIVLVMIGIFSVSLRAQTTPTPSEVTPEHRLPIIAHHNPVTSALENEPIDITVDIKNVLPGDKVILHFREKGQLDFYNRIMGYNPETGMYETTIDERYHSHEILEYYIEILPVNADKIRIPRRNNEYFEIESYRSSDKIIRGFLYIILIASPALLYYLWNRLNVAHAKRTAKYRQKLNKRKRELIRQREKHYKAYLEKISGKKRPSRTYSTGGVPRKTDSAISAKTKSRSKPRQSLKQREVKPLSKPSSSTTVPPDEKVSTGELKRELDEILKHTETIRPAPRKAPPGTTSRISTKTKPLPPGARVSKRKSGPDTERKTGKIPPPSTPTPRKDRKEVRSETPQPRKKTPGKLSPTEELAQELDKALGSLDKPSPKPGSGKLKKDDRDKLLDILGLDI